MAQHQNIINSPTENLYKISGKVMRVLMLIDVGHETKS